MKKGDSFPVRVVASHEDGEATYYATEDSLMRQEKGSWDVSIIPYKYIASLKYTKKRNVAFSLVGFVTLAFGLISLLYVFQGPQHFLTYVPTTVLGTLSIELGLFLRKRYVVRARIGDVEVETWMIKKTKAESINDFVNTIRQKIRKP